MKNTAILLLLVAAMTGCNSAPETTTEASKPADTVAAAPAEAPAPAPALDSATKAKNSMDYMTPGDMQKMLASMTGKWNSDVTTFIPAEGKSKATIECSMIMGGRFQVMKFKGTMMGMPFEGSGMLGYDNLRKVFTNAWVDNMSTGIIYMEGAYDEATKTIDMKGKCTDPETGGQCEMRQVIKIIDDKNHTMEMYMTPTGGQEMKFMESKETKA